MMTRNKKNTIQDRKEGKKNKRTRRKRSQVRLKSVEVFTFPPQLIVKLLKLPLVNRTDKSMLEEA